MRAEFVQFTDAIEDVSSGNARVPSSEFRQSGTLAIVDQGRSEIAGYTDNVDLACKTVSPLIVFGDHTRAIKYVNFPFAIGADGVKVLRARPGFDTKYLFHYLLSHPLPGAGYSRHFKFLKQVEVPRLPVAEQRRIAEILDHADALRAKRRRLVSYLDALRDALFDDTFGRAGPESVRVGDIIKWSSGQFLPEKLQNGGPHPVYGGNGVNGSHDSFMFEEPVLVVGRVGAYCGVVHVTRPRSWVTDNALVATLLRSDMSLGYLLPALNAANLNRFAGVSGQPSISAAKIADVRIPVPSSALQEVFNRLTGEIDERLRVARVALAVDDELFASLQSRAFRGEL